MYPVGRGRCNNPFYGDTGPNFLSSCPPLSTIGAVTGKDDICRSTFSNHAYGKMSGKVYDSCMKIRNGWLINLSQAAYANTVIDESTLAEDIGGSAAFPIPNTMQVY